MIVTFFIFLVEVALGDRWYYQYYYRWETPNELIRQFQAQDMAACKSSCQLNTECNAINFGTKDANLNKCELFGSYSPQFARDSRNKQVPTQVSSDMSWNAFYILRNPEKTGDHFLSWLFYDMPKERRENKRSCTVRFHKSSDCMSTDRFFHDKEGLEGDMDGDVLWQWTTMGTYKTVIWERYDGWLREDDNPPGYKYDQSLIDMFQDRTSAISFSGDCAKMELFDEKAGDPSLWGAVAPGASTLKKFGLMPHEGNCVYDNGDIQTAGSCHWSCQDRKGCPGKTANCIQFDRNLYIQGFYMRPVDGVDVTQARGVVGLLPKGAVNLGLFVVISAVTLVIVTLARVAFCRKVGDEEILD